MQFFMKILILSVFLSISSLAEIIVERSDPIESALVEAVVQMLELCYGDRITAVGLAGNSTGAISRMLWSRGNSPITMIDVTARFVSDDPVGELARRKLQVYVVAASTSSELTSTLSEIRASVWWDHMAAFILLDWPSSSVNHECRNAFEMLWPAWKMNILNAKFVCYDGTKGRQIYTFNPYTSRAPGSWELEQIHTERHQHPWTLFRRGYNEVVCDELDFERADDLGGYEIRVAVTDESFGYARGPTARPCHGVFDDIFCQIILGALNATAKIQLRRTLGVLSLDGAGASGILGDVANGSTDIGITARLLTTLTNMTIAYPAGQCDLRTMTQHRGFKSQLSKIRSVVDGGAQIGILLVCLVTVAFFRFVVGENAKTAGFDTLRIICSTCVPKLPVDSSARIYLSGVFLFAITMQGIYQGRLASLLTRQEALRNVDSIQDLAELGHRIYGFPTFALYFTQSDFDGRFVETKEVGCSNFVVNDPGAACVGDKSTLTHDAVKYKLHVSRESVGLISTAMPIRPDWPLEHRVNEILRRSVESHRIQYMVDNVTYATDRYLQHLINEAEDKRATILTLGQLAFAFAILGVGLGAATLSFVAEVISGRRRRRRREEE